MPTLKGQSLIDPNDRALAINDLKRADMYLRDALSTLISVNAAGLTSQEMIFISQRRDIINRVIQDITTATSHLLKQQPAPLSGQQATPGPITTGTLPRPTIGNFTYIGTQIHKRLVGYKPGEMPAAAITHDPKTDYTELHNQVGCIDCKDACRQYLTIGPACNKAHDINQKVNQDGKCIDHKPL